MRILYISNSTSGGGAPASLFNLIEGVRKGNQVAVVMPHAHGALYEKLQDKGVTLYAEMPYALDIRPRSLNPFRLIHKYAMLWRNRHQVSRYIGRIIDEFKPDIIHTNVGPLAIGFKEASRRGIPHVWHMREYQDKDFGMTFFPSKKAFMRLIHSKGNYCIAITRDIFRHWELDPKKDIVVYNAIIKGSRPSLNDCAPDGGKYFLYAGRIEKPKALMTLLKAFRKYRKNGGENSLLVAGRPCGLYSVLCKAYTRLSGLTPSVDFLGQRNDVAELMAQAEAFIMSSHSEGFGLTTAEAMLNGCVVIGRNTAGTKEQFDRGEEITGSEIGLRFENVDQLASQLEYVSDKANSSHLQQIRENAERVVSTEYTAERYVSDILKFYQSIISYTS
jgi:glycosyltransferase involved in cell wall biosynthesis